jgi:hypothetical protein
MKQCLNCQNDFEYKREAAKFCSDKCRAAYNRAHPEKQITKLQLQSLYNAVLEAVEKIQYAAPQKEYNSPKLPPTMQDEPLSFGKQRQQTELPTFQSLLNGMADLVFADDKEEYAHKIHAATHLSDKQRELLFNNLRNLRF